MAERERVLFSCAGTTDPVRGCRDGGLLHIMRHYRPKKIYLFLSSEMAAYEQRDRRFTKAVAYARENWQDYAPELTLLPDSLDRPDDLDAVYPPLTAAFRQVVAENPSAEMLINLSSGTPQMKVVLAQLALDVRYDALGIQVSNPEKRSGTAPRTNKRDFDVDYELQLNEDDEPDAPNRCTEPRMLAMQRETRRERIRSLLDRRDYRALEAMKDELPEAVRPLVSHLCARSELQRDEALRCARKLTDLPFKLYPVLRSGDDRYKVLSEYYLLLRNLHLTQRYSEFVLRLNPFLVQLLLRLLELSLPCPLEALLEPRRDGRVCLSPDRMEAKLPELKQGLEHLLGETMKERCDFSLHLGVLLLRLLKADEAQWAQRLQLLSACETLNTRQRNIAAHRLHAVTAQQLREDCVDDAGRHYRAEELVNALGQLLRSAYFDVCDPQLFTIYDRCNDYIRENL